MCYLIFKQTIQDILIFLFHSAWWPPSDVTSHHDMLSNKTSLFILSKNGDQQYTANRWTWLYWISFQNPTVFSSSGSFNELWRHHVFFKVFNRKSQFLSCKNSKRLKKMQFEHHISPKKPLLSYTTLKMKRIAAIKYFLCDLEWISQHFLQKTLISYFSYYNGLHIKIRLSQKLDRVGPVDNRPSSD